MTASLRGRVSALTFLFCLPPRLASLRPPRLPPWFPIILLCLHLLLSRLPARPHPSVPSTSTVVPAPSNSGLCSGVPGCSASPVDVQGSPISPPLPSFESVLHVRVPTLRHVPKTSRNAWAGVVGDICQTIVSDPTDLGSWVKLFMLARCILANPSRGGRSHWRDTQKAVKTRIAKWKAGQLSELWDGILAENNRLNNLIQKRSNSPVPANIHRARRAVEDGQFRKAIQILSSAGIAPSSSDVYDAMLSKHPQSAPPPIPSKFHLLYVFLSWTW